MARRALLVGLNAYPNPANALRGCLNDVRQMSALLTDHFGFEVASLRTLTDARATTAAIRARLGWLVQGARPGDVLVFHYSGHGSQVPDRHGDETSDGLDEIICPYDLDWHDPFTDDDLGAILAGVPAEASLTVVLDCCHAGTGLREMGVPAGYRDGALLERRCLPPPEHLAWQAGQTSRPHPHVGQVLRRFGATAAEAGAVLLAASRDDQPAADALIDGAYHGALTYSLCEVLAAGGYATTYQALLQRVRRMLRERGFDQEPQLEGPAERKLERVFAPCSK